MRSCYIHHNMICVKRYNKVMRLCFITISNILRFTMAMPFDMILILYVIPCKLSRDFSKLTILYIHVHIFL